VLPNATTAYNKIYLLRRCGAVAPRVLGPTRQRSRTKHKRDACFVLCREALRAQLVTQLGFPDLINDTGVTNRQVNSTLAAICWTNYQPFGGMDLL